LTFLTSIRLASKPGIVSQGLRGKGKVMNVITDVVQEYHITVNTVDTSGVL
jgi:hypothetical protein